MLKAQDLLLALKLAVADTPFGSFAELGDALGLGSGEAYRSANRAAASRLIDLNARRALVSNVVEFAVHGAPYAFPAQRGALTRGMATGVAAAPLRYLIAVPDTGNIPVWPDPDGSERGYSLEPLYPSVPHAARRDPKLYEVLALVDALREGRARERNLAAHHLAKRLGAEQGALA